MVKCCESGERAIPYLSFQFMNVRLLKIAHHIIGLHSLAWLGP